MLSFFHLLPFSVNDIVCKVYARIGGTQPYETVVTLLEITGVTVIVIVVESVLNTVQRVAVDIGIIAGNEYASTQAKFQTQVSFLVERTCITDAQTGPAALAFPAFLFVEADTVYGTLGIGAQICADELTSALEIAANLQLAVTDLAELVVIPVTVVGECETGIGGIMAVQRIVLKLYVDTRCESESGDNRKVMNQVGPDSHHVTAGILFGLSR
jgi:hypothetical protein